MAEQLDAGAAYLASLKRPTSSTAAGGAAAAPAPEKANSTSAHSHLPVTRPAQAEKRRSPRYRCAGSARLQELGSATTVWATFTDLSMHGCYVEAPNPFAVGTILNLRLEANGFRVDAAGEVRVSYPGVGMGISLARMGESDRETLGMLVRSIARVATVLSSHAATQSLSVQPDETWRAVSNPAAALQGMFTFFENRHMMGREEFLRIVRTSQKAASTEL